MLLFNTLGIFFTFGKDLVGAVNVFSITRYVLVLFFFTHCLCNNIVGACSLPVHGGFTLISEFLLAGSENKSDGEKCKNWLHGVSIIGSVDQKYINNPK